MWRLSCMLQGSWCELSWADYFLLLLLLPPPWPSASPDLRKTGKTVSNITSGTKCKGNLHKQLLYPRHPGPSTVGRTGSPRGPTGSSRASVAAARLLDESATWIHCRVAGAPLPRLLQRTITNTSMRSWFLFPISSYFLSLTHLHLKDWS